MFVFLTPDVLLFFCVSSFFCCFSPSRSYPSVPAWATRATHSVLFIHLRTLCVYGLRLWYIIYIYIGQLCSTLRLYTKQKPAILYILDQCVCVCVCRHLYTCFCLNFRRLTNRKMDDSFFPRFLLYVYMGWTLHLSSIRWPSTLLLVLTRKRQKLFGLPRDDSWNRLARRLKRRTQNGCCTHRDTQWQWMSLNERKKNRRKSTKSP